MRWLAVLLALLLVVPAAALPGRLDRFPAMATPGLAPRNVTIWLPPGYDTGKGRYAVLYMHDEHNLFDPATAMGGQTWGVAEALARLIAARQARPTIIVGIDNTPARRREYMPAGVSALLPAADRARFEASIGGPPLSDAYLRFIVGTLKPMIDRRYRTDRSASATFLTGSSMGGLISLYGVTEYPKVFGGAAGLSTHWPLPFYQADQRTPALALAPVAAAFEAYLGPRLPRPGTHRLWFDHGDRDLDEFYAPYQARIDALLARHGLRQPRDFVSRAYPGSGHNETSWRSRIEDPLRYLLGPSR